MKLTTAILFAIGLITFSCEAQTITDIDGNVYDTIHIGSQAWTKPNLKVTHYLNGDPIPNVTDSAQWYGLTSGAYCDYNNDPNHSDVYGRLYNWYAVNDPRGIAPPGWHMPTYEDWDTLQIFLGYDLIAGGKLKEIGTAHWVIPNTGATDEYDFTAQPGGQRADSIYSGTFTEMTQQGYWWSSSEVDTVYPWAVNISYNSEGFTNWAASTRKSGFSIRLISDFPSGIDVNTKDESFNIYPNPASEAFVIRSPSLAGKDVFIFITDITGKIIYKSAVIKSGKLTINTNDFADGVYIVQLRAPGILQTRKVIIAK